MLIGARKQTKNNEALINTLNVRYLADNGRLNFTTMPQFPIAPKNIFPYTDLRPQAPACGKSLSLDGVCFSRHC